MRTSKNIRTALTIAGSDSGGGAGIQADLKTFAATGVHGACAITCITAQNPRSVLGVQACSPEIVRLQLEAVFAELRPAAAKTGMLYSAAIINAVADFLERRTPHGAHDSNRASCNCGQESRTIEIGRARLAQPPSERARLPLVVDPVMVSTSGAPLLKPSAVKTLRSRLLPLATLITPNLQEAEILVGRKLDSVEDLRSAARILHGQFGSAVLVKGGHLRGLNEAVDIFYDGKQEMLLSAPYIRGVSTHGTGCTYSAAIAGYLARGLALADAVCRAKEFITQAIAQSHTTAGHSLLNSFWSEGARPLPLI
jgi:hydroxymethylpyrimidine/phosphomethylpyrimidine kinase